MSVSIIILGSNPATKLGLIRSVGTAFDCKITVINLVSSMSQHRRVPIDCRSKYVEKYYYALKYNEESLCSVLMENCREQQKPIILSVDDDSANMIDKLQDRLRDSFVCANIGGKAGEISRLMDKSVQKQLAVNFGLNVACSWQIEIINGKFEIPEDIIYPCYLKGLESFHSLKNFQGRCDNETELRNRLAGVAQLYSCPMLVEEFLEIDKDFGLIGFSNGQDCVIPGMVELQESGFGGHKGVSAYGLVRPFRAAEKKYVTQILQFIKSLNLFGLFNVDLVECGGKLYFIELNLRYAAYGNAVSQSGVNLPAFFVRTACGLNTEDMPRVVEQERHYVNEFVVSDDFIGGYRSLRGVMEILKKADARLMKDDADPVPYRILKVNTVEFYIKNRIKKLIRR